MKKPVKRALLKLHRVQAHRMMGVVLPVVLVVLTILTGLVVTQIRRGAVDERLASNTRESVQLDSSVQTVLRWCEARITLAPQTTGTVTPGTSLTVPAWAKTSANWNPGVTSLDFSGGANLLPGLNADPSCVIENATCELYPPISPTGQVAASNPACIGAGELDPRWRKFRITARVATLAPDMIGGNRFTFAQSELRLFIE
ncbi:MAG: hypothetical protein ABI580_02760 [Burkholderiaceae bacterium]